MPYEPDYYRIDESEPEPKYPKVVAPHVKALVKEIEQEDAEYDAVLRFMQKHKLITIDEMYKRTYRLQEIMYDIVRDDKTVEEIDDMWYEAKALMK